MLLSMDSVHVKEIKKTRNDKTVRQRFLTCSYAGFKKIKSDVLYQKRDFRTGCKAYIQFDVDKESGLYCVVKHEMEHNHSRVPVSKRHLIRSHRKVSGDQLAMVTSLSENGIPIADAYRVIRDQAGCEANLSFLQRDLYVALSGEKKKNFDGCDTKQLISYFKERKSKEYVFYYDFDVDEKEAINECASRIEILLRKDGNEEGHGKENDDNTDAQAAAQCLESGNLLEPQDVIQANVFQDSPTSAEKPIENEKECMVKDPIRRRKKGQKNIRLKSTQEKICNKLKGQKIKSWKKKSAKGVSIIKKKAQDTIKDSLTVLEGNTLAHSSLFGGSIEYFEPDEYFEVHVTPFT
uniref:FAR1 domain-containing protein n=1 Tax=Chenopodium quinoa TaxID=63459 RepID=A0A803MA16_CHEQI